MSTSEATSRRAEYTQRTHDALVESAAELFTTVGYAQTTIEQIARAARVTKGAVYHHFPDKPALFAHVFEDECQKALAQIHSTATANTSGFAALLAGVSLVFDQYTCSPRLRSLGLQATAALGEERRREIQAGGSIPLVKAVLDGLAAQGQLADVDTQTAAEMVLDLIFTGAVAYARDVTPDNRARIENTVAALISGIERTSSS